MPDISNYQALTNDELARILEDLGVAETMEHRGILLLEAGRRLRAQQPRNGATMKDPDIPRLIDLVDRVVDGWKDEWREDHPDQDFHLYLNEAVPEVVPCMTTTLFAMVVQDNSLAWLETEDVSSEPFRCLSSAINEEVERLATNTIEGLLETEAEDDDG